MTANVCDPQNPFCTAERTPVVELFFPSATVTMFPKVAQRYATITTSDPQNRYRLIDRRSTISTPMFSGTSIPSSARITSPKNVQLAESGTQFEKPENEVAESFPPTSQRTPARPITKIAAPEKTTTRFA